MRETDENVHREDRVGVHWRARQYTTSHWIEMNASVRRTATVSRAIQTMLFGRARAWSTVSQSRVHDRHSK